MMDATLLLPITGTPLTGIEFYKRLPCGEVEHTRRVSSFYLKLFSVTLVPPASCELLTLSLTPKSD